MGAYQHGTNSVLEMRPFFYFLFSFLFLVCPANAETIIFSPTTFTALTGWSEGGQKGALVAFQKSCNVLQKRSPAKILHATLPMGKTIQEWLPACKVAAVTPITDKNATVFFERFFAPYTLSTPSNKPAEFTGYYISTLKGSPRKGGIYQYPIYGLPPFVKASPTKPTFTREQIDKGALGNSTPVLYYATNPIDVFFLHVQGSGVIEQPDGTVRYVGFAGRNNQPYFPIGRELVKRGILTKETVTMQTIRAWLEKQPPETARQFMAQNTSYIFFQEQPAQKSMLGAMGVPLTAQHSLALDPAFLPLGVPLWLATEKNNRLPFALQKLVIAQDTGAAIKGALRGDFFWGVGENAAHHAGNMHSLGTLHILLPRP